MAGGVLVVAIMEVEMEMRDRSRTESSNREQALIYDLNPGILEMPWF
jgi:hypothetical protein